MHNYLVEVTKWLVEEYPCTVPLLHVGRPAKGLKPRLPATEKSISISFKFSANNSFTFSPNKQKPTLNRNRAESLNDFCRGIVPLGLPVMPVGVVVGHGGCGWWDGN